MKNMNMKLEQKEIEYVKELVAEAWLSKRATEQLTDDEQLALYGKLMLGGKRRE